MRSSSYFKIVSRILILAMLNLCWLTSYGYAEMIPTESAIEQSSTSNTDRQRLLDLLNRQDVVDELGKYGITKVEAVARVNSLTDEEITVIAGKLDELPEGGFVELFGPILILYGAVMLAGYLIYLPGLLLFCPFSDDSYGECISSYSGKYWALFSSGHSVDNECTKKCGDQWTSCTGSKEYNEEFLEIRRQCNLDNDECLKICQTGEVKETEQKQYDFPCYAKFSDCMRKVTGAALTESICVKEKDRCLHQSRSMDGGSGSNQHAWCQDEVNRWTLCKAP